MPLPRPRSGIISAEDMQMMYRNTLLSNIIIECNEKVNPASLVSCSWEDLKNLLAYRRSGKELIE